MTRAIERFRELVEFCGPRTISCLIAGTVLGVSTFVVELAFAFGLQSFLVTLGVTSADTLNLPPYLRFESVYGVVGLLVGIGLFRALFLGFQEYVKGYATEQYKDTQRARVLAWSFLSRHTSASEAVYLFSERVMTSSALVMLGQSVLFSTLVAVGLGLSLLKMSPLLTAIAAAGILALYLPLQRLSSSVGTLGKEVTDQNRNLLTHLLTTIKNLLFIRIYGIQSTELQSAHQRLDRGLQANLRYLRQHALIAALPQFVGVLLICVLMLAARQTRLEPGLTLSFCFLFTRLAGTLSVLVSQVGMMRYKRHEFSALWRWWKEVRPEVNTALGFEESRRAVSPEPFSSPVGFLVRGLTFSYPGRATTPVIRQLNLEVPPSKLLAIYGPSGVGKSTLLGLLLGELTPDSGSIAIVTEAREAPLQDIRQRLLASVGYVGPEPFLFEGDALRNLTYGLTHEPTDLELRAALSAAKCDFLGTDAASCRRVQITEQGQGLSAGQKQRLSLARALLRKPRLLVLDEATANLDRQTESEVIETIQALRASMTVIAVTHREAILQAADEVLELKPA